MSEYLQVATERKSGNSKENAKVVVLIAMDPFALIVSTRSIVLSNTRLKPQQR